MGLQAHRFGRPTRHCIRRPTRACTGQDLRIHPYMSTLGFTRSPARHSLRSMRRRVIVHRLDLLDPVVEPALEFPLGEVGGEPEDYEAPVGQRRGSHWSEILQGQASLLYPFSEPVPGDSYRLHDVCDAADRDLCLVGNLHRLERVRPHRFKDQQTIRPG